MYMIIGLIMGSIFSVIGVIANTKFNCQHKKNTKLNKTGENEHNQHISIDE